MKKKTIATLLCFFMLIFLLFPKILLTEEKETLRKNPKDYDEPIVFLEKEILKEKSKLFKLEEKEKQRKEKLRTVEEKLQKKHLEIDLADLRDFIEYIKESKGEARLKAMEIVKENYGITYYQLQFYDDLIKDHNLEIEQSKARLKTLNEEKNIVKAGKAEADRLEQKEMAHQEKKDIMDKSQDAKEYFEKREELYIVPIIGDSVVISF